MPDSCYAVGCSNRRSKGSALKFYRIPFGSDDKSLELRKKWVRSNGIYGQERKANQQCQNM